MFHILNQGELAFCTKRGGTVYLRVGMVMYTWGRRYIRGGGYCKPGCVVYQLKCTVGQRGVGCQWEVVLHTSRKWHSILWSTLGWEIHFVTPRVVPPVQTFLGVMVAPPRLEDPTDST